MKNGDQIKYTGKYTGAGLFFETKNQKIGHILGEVVNGYAHVLFSFSKILQQNNPDHNWHSYEDDTVSRCYIKLPVRDLEFIRSCNSKKVIPDNLWSNEWLNNNHLKNSVNIPQNKLLLV